MGALTKKGAIVKNWKHRYFVVNPDFSVAYYETEEVSKNWKSNFDQKVSGLDQVLTKT